MRGISVACEHIRVDRAASRAPIARLVAALNVVGFLLRAAVRFPERWSASSLRAALSAMPNASRAHMVGLRPRHILEHVR